MFDHSKNKESLSHSLRQRKILSFSVVGLIVLGTVGVFAIQGIAQRNAANAAFAEAQDDYVATWCATFGATSFDITALDTWYAFIERNREFLESNEELKITENATGKVGLDLQFTLDLLAEIYGPDDMQSFFITEVRQDAPNYFWSTHQFFAKEKNELGNPLPIACN